MMPLIFCDNTSMKSNLSPSLAAPHPLLREENGELSLHFNFPTIQSRMLTADPQRLILDYTRTMMGFLLLLPKPGHIAMIGLGGGSLAKYCYHSLPQADFTAIELCPEVIALRERFDIPADDSRFRIVCADGAEFVRRAKESFDVLMVDGFDHDGQPEALSSTEFYDNCHAALRTNGVLVVNLCSDDPKRDLYLSRLNTSFNSKVILAEADEGENTIAFASKGLPFPPQFSEITDRLRQLESHHPVELDQTAQKILGRSSRKPQTRRKKR
ncbi:MAG: transferase [Betaproteobacteria bacterium]